MLEKDEIRLSDYDIAPLYNIKAVVQASAISPSTLRAWERRYHVCKPDRSSSGYRLYSERDVAVIRWLKVQVDSGMAISQAVAWMNSISAKAEAPSSVVLPLKNVQSQSTSFDRPNGGMLASRPLDFVILQQELLESLLNFNEEQAEAVLTAAFARYPVEQVGEQLMTPVLIEIGRLWQAGTVSITREHYAAGYLRHRLAVLFRAAPARKGGPMIWVGCAPGELHEIAAQMFALYARQAGMTVQYLGQSINQADLLAEAGRQKPSLIVLGASGTETAASLARCAFQLAQMEEANRPHFGYGGRIFDLEPRLRADIPGIYLGATTSGAVATVHQLLS